MTPRYRHWIQPANEGQWPTAVLCLDCCSNHVDGRGVVHTVKERLTSVAVVLLLRSEGEYLYSGESSTTEAASLLESLRQLSDQQAALLVVSYQCQRVWSLLHIWEEIEDGRLAICDSDYRNSQAYRQRVREYRRAQADPLRPLGGSEERRLAPSGSGYLVCEDPPNVLRGRLHNARNNLTWIDVRNHGVEPPPGTPPGRQTVSWIAILVKRMLQLCSDNGLTALKATAGSQAMSAWRHHYLQESVHVHTDAGATRLEGQAYFGGRCEAIRVGTVPNPVYHIDFRSQYGWVCANRFLPTRLLDYHEGGDRPLPDDQSFGRDLIADVTVETDEPAYPLRRNDAIIYPVGRYRTVLCGPEYWDALQMARVRTVHAVAVYAVGNPLRDYALSLYLLRCQEERDDVPGSADWCKRLIVSLPGKLGQLNHRWVDCPGVMPQTMYGEWYAEGAEGELIRYRAIAGLVQRDVVDGFAADSVPSIAAFVTSHARVRLLSAIRTAGWNHVHYYDTDSLMVDQTGYDRLRMSEFMAGDGMGFLTLRSQPERLEIRGVKYYVEDDRVTCSGLARGHVRDAGDGLHYHRSLTAAEQARRGQRPEAVVVTGTYERVEAYTQRVVRADGSTEPIRVRE